MIDLIEHSLLFRKLREYRRWSPVPGLYDADMGLSLGGIEVQAKNNGYHAFIVRVKREECFAILSGVWEDAYEFRDRWATWWRGYDVDGDGMLFVFRDEVDAAYMRLRV